MQQYLAQELARIAEAISGIEDGERDILYVEPDKPQLGQRVYADGTQWNPGSGPGAYSYEGTSTAVAVWVKL
jgi:hypothetical protein